MSIWAHAMAGRTFRARTASATAGSPNSNDRLVSASGSGTPSSGAAHGDREPALFWAPAWLRPPLSLEPSCLTVLRALVLGLPVVTTRRYAWSLDLGSVKRKHRRC
jgi:hypothetical protein